MMTIERLPRFRRAEVVDIPAMSAIRLAVTENVLRDPARVTRQMYVEYLEAAGRGWVAEVDGEVAAFCYAAKEDGSIWALFVAPRHEGLGLAKRLLGLAVDYLFDFGHDSVTLSTGSDTRADRFYAAQGWTRGEPREHEVVFTLNKPGT
jgi:GNAT superfamily N-acetyltransferase